MHRQPSACLNCHQQIDPWGIAFEHFDATGRWRDSVHSIGSQSESQQAVNATTTLPDGKQIERIQQLKRHLRRDYADSFARSLTHHFLTYSMGREPDFGDEPDVRNIRDEFAASGYKLKRLVLAFVQSPLFHPESATRDP